MRMRISAKDVLGHVCYYEQLDSLTIYLPYEISTNQPILQCIRAGVGKLHTGRVSYIVFRWRVGKGRRRVISQTDLFDDPYPIHILLSSCTERCGSTV